MKPLQVQETQRNKVAYYVLLVYYNKTTMAPSTESNRSVTSTSSMEDLSASSCDRIRSGSISDSGNASMTIFVVEHDSQSHQQHLLFGVGHADTVHTLKHKIADRRGIPLEQQRLVFGGKQLEDDCKLSDYKIRAQSCIHLDM